MYTNQLHQWLLNFLLGSFAIYEPEEVFMASPRSTSPPPPPPLGLIGIANLPSLLSNLFREFNLDAGDFISSTGSPELGETLAVAASVEPISMAGLGMSITIWEDNVAEEDEEEEREEGEASPS